MTGHDPGCASFKLSDAGSYDTVAAAFDRWTDRVTTGKADRLLALARLDGDERVLDVGTGTGIVPRRAVARYGARLAVLGIDLSEGMLRFASSRAVAEGIDAHTTFRRMDAEALDLADASFDVVVSLFALAHFPNPGVAVGEMYRVLRPGGRLVVGVGYRPAVRSLAGVIHGCRRLPDLFRRAVGRQLVACEFLDTLTARHVPEAAEPELAGWFQHGRDVRRSVPRLLRDAGFTGVSVQTQADRTVLASPDEFWELQATFSTMARKRLGTAPAEVVDRVRTDFFEACRRVQARGGTLVYPSGALFTSGRRPGR